jgi:hypothetical protein
MSAMAKTIVTEYTDDLDGSKAQGTVRFSYGGTAYEIDLSSKNTKAFEKVLSPYLAAARKVRGGVSAPTRRSRSAGTPKRNLGEVRAWAQSNGYQVADRGRIPAAVVEAFDSKQ